jgi:hypothetical protein
MPYAELKRIWSAVTPELNKKLTDYSNELGVTKSMLINLCVRTGFQALERAINPERVLTKEQWKMIIETSDLDEKTIKEMTK